MTITVIMIDFGGAVIMNDSVHFQPPFVHLPARLRPIRTRALYDQAGKFPCFQGRASRRLGAAVLERLVSPEKVVPWFCFQCPAPDSSPLCPGRCRESSRADAKTLPQVAQSIGFAW